MYGAKLHNFIKKKKFLKIGQLVQELKLGKCSTFLTEGREKTGQSVHSHD